MNSKYPAPTPEKLAAWARVRAWWKACKCHGVCVELLDLEWEAKNTD